MPQNSKPAELAFPDRRVAGEGSSSPDRERRQFANRHEDLSPAARELALAIDRYKLEHRRRIIDYEEMLAVIRELGYEQRTATSSDSP